MNSVDSLFQAKYNVEYTSIHSSCNVVMDIQLISGCKVAIFQCAECDIHFAIDALHDMHCPLCNVQYAVSTMHYAICCAKFIPSGHSARSWCHYLQPPLGPDTGPLLSNQTRMPLMIIKIAVEAAAER